MVCLKCGFINDPDADFCENCGSPAARTCSTCGAHLKPGTRFCKKCGSPVSITHQGLSALQRAAPPELQEKMRSAARQLEGQRKSVTILFADIVDSPARPSLGAMEQRTTAHTNAVKDALQQGQ